MSASNTKDTFFLWLDKGIVRYDNATGQKLRTGEGIKNDKTLYLEKGTIAGVTSDQTDNDRPGGRLLIKMVSDAGGVKTIKTKHPLAKARGAVVKLGRDAASNTFQLIMVNNGSRKKPQGKVRRVAIDLT